MIYVRIAGGLANQIYQYMGGYALARELGQKLILDISMVSNGFTRGFLLNCFPGIKYEALIRNTCATGAGTIDNIDSVKKDFLSEKHVLSLNPKCNDERIDVEEYHGLNAVFDRSKKDYYLCGNWIDRAYWEKYAEELRNIFFAPAGIDGYIEDFRNKDLKNAVGVHLRRGDFVYHGYTEDDDPEYFKGAVRYLKEKNKKYEFYIFSDDMEYARDVFGPDSSSIHYVHSMDGLIGDITDFCCLSLCRIKVVSGGSTYSRLAYELNPYPEKKFIVKNSNDTGIQHNIRNFIAANSHIKAFDCININKKEYSSYAERYEAGTASSDSKENVKDEEMLSRCRLYCEKGEYEKAEQIAHKIWFCFDNNPFFHEIYGNILYNLNRRKEAAVEYSRSMVETEGLHQDISEETLLYRKSERTHYIIMPDYELRGVTSLKGILLVGIMLRRLGNRVSFLIRHNEYYSNYLKRSKMLTDQDGTQYDCSLYSINDLDPEGVTELIGSLRRKEEKTVLIGNEAPRTEGMEFFSMREEDFKKEAPVEEVKDYSFKDVFRIDDRYFDIVREIL